ncbi:hypothetical protein LWI28_011495 [Acer negundo]|uniref:Cytochrome P450 n=1 Tax=Acer negundo TaxID=4023 RepID=A0AAD5IPT9_ACENE|nr:hypothetical protein LWI28_011495 [Acer negundo]
MTRTFVFAIRVKVWVVKFPHLELEMALQSVLKQFRSQLVTTVHDQLLEYNTLFLFLLLILPLVILIVLKQYLLKSDHHKLNLPPSPPKLPIIGNLHQLGTLPHRSLRALSHKPKTTAANIFLYGCRDIGFAPYGEYWRHARKICVLELLSMKRVQSFTYVRQEEVEILLNKIRLSCFDGGIIDLTVMLQAVANNVVSRCVLGRKAEEENGPGKFGVLSRRVMVLLTAFCFGDVFPSLAWLDVVTGHIGRINTTFKAIDALLDQVIEEHRSSNGDDVDDQFDKKDFVHILLQLQKEGMFEIDLTQNDIKAILMDMFVGGTDTTSTVFQAFQFVREEEVANMVAKIRLSSLSGAAVDLTEMFAAISNNIISKSALGRVYEGDGNKNFAALSRTVMELTGAFCFEDLFPFFGWMDNLTGLAAKLKSTCTALHNFFDQVIEEHQVSRSRDDKSEKKDFVDLLLHFHQKDGGHDIDLTHESIKGILLDMFIGGTDTTATTMEWAMAELVKNPKGRRLDMSDDYVMFIRKKVPLRLVPVMRSS